MAKIVRLLSTNLNIKTRKFYPYFMGVKLKSLAIREEHILRVYENEELRGIFGPMKQEVIDGY
jgi:hypothetical protein